MVILCYVQIDITIAIIKHTRALFGIVVAITNTHRQRIPTCTTIVESTTHTIGIDIILPAVRVRWIAPVCHNTIFVQHIVAMPWAIRCTNTTKIDIGIAIGIG